MGKRLDKRKQRVYRCRMTKGAEQLARYFERPQQKAIAQRLKISDPHLSLLRHGKRIPSMRVAALIEKELGIPVQAWTQESEA